MRLDNLRGSFLASVTSFETSRRKAALSMKEKREHATRTISSDSFLKSFDKRKNLSRVALAISSALPTMKGWRCNDMHGFIHLKLRDSKKPLSTIFRKSIVVSGYMTCDKLDGRSMYGLAYCRAFDLLPITFDSIFL